MSSAERGPEQPPLFPLPLEAYERYMLADDSPDYPMAFVIAIDVSGDLRFLEFESALQAALVRHPLLGCRVELIGGKGWCWKPVARRAVSVEWIEGDRPLESPRGERIDLMREVGLRVQVCHARNAARVNFQFHHAATDGIGAVQFIGDVLAIYGQSTAAPGDEIPELEPLNPQLLIQRGRLWRDGVRPRRGFLLRTAGRVLEMLWQSPAILAARASPKVCATQDSSIPAFVSRTLPRDVHIGLKARAAAKGVTVNDLLVLDMYHTIRDWNQLCGRNDRRTWYRLGLPLSLRTPMDDDLPAANVLSFLFMTRRARDCDREDELLQFIHRETESVIQGEARLMFAHAVGLLLKAPGLLAGLLRVPACQATAILANVGDVRRQFRGRFPLKQGRCVAGNVILDALLGAAPIRNRTRLAVSLGTYAGMYLVNMQCDHRFFTRDDAERLADLFTERIRRRARGSDTAVNLLETSRAA